MKQYDKVEILLDSINGEFDINDEVVLVNDLICYNKQCDLKHIGLSDLIGETFVIIDKEFLTYNYWFYDIQNKNTKEFSLSSYNLEKK